MTSQAEDRSAERPGLVITAVGPDRSGLIFDLSTKIKHFGANIEDTKMSKLGGMFAVLMLVTGSETALNEIIAHREAFEAALGVNCSFAPTQASRKNEGTIWRFSASGVDRPGIVTAVSDILASNRVNIISFLSHIENAPLTGTPLFVLDVECVIPEQLSQSNLRDELQIACEREGLELVAVKD